MALQKLNLNQKFYNFKEDGEKLINTILVEGHYVAQVEGKFGPQYQFQDAERGIVTLGGGQLKAAVEKNIINLGDYVQIIYRGMETMSGGKYAGNKVHNFEIATDPEKRQGQDTVAAVSIAQQQVTTAAPAEIAQAQEEVAAQVAATPAATTPTTSTSDLLAKYK